MKDIQFDDEYDDGEGTLTLYYTAPKEILNRVFPRDSFPEAESAEISIEVPSDKVEAKYAIVSISPTMEIDGSKAEYDWEYIDIPLEEIAELLKKR